MSQFKRYIEMINEGKKMKKENKNKKRNDNPYDYVVQPEDMYTDKFTPASKMYDDNIYSTSKHQEIHNKRMAERDRQEAMSNAGHRPKTETEKKREKLASDKAYDNTLKDQDALPWDGGRLKTFLDYAETKDGMKALKDAGIYIKPVANISAKALKKIDHFKKYLGSKFEDFWNY